MKRSKPEPSTCKFERAQRARDFLNSQMPPELTSIISGYFIGFEGTVSRRVSTQKLPFSLCAAGNNEIAIGFGDGTITLWDRNSGEKRELLGHNSGVCCLASVEKECLISGSLDHTACVWDLHLGTARFPLIKHTGPVVCVAQLSETHLATGSEDGLIVVWCAPTGAELYACAHADAVWALARLTTTTFASGSADRTVKIWRSDTGDCLFTLQQPSVVYALALLPNGLLAVGSWLSEVALWDLMNSCVVKKLKGRGSFKAFVQTSNELFAAEDGSPWVAHGLCTETFKAKHRFTFNGCSFAVAALPNECLVLATNTGFHIYQ